MYGLERVESISFHQGMRIDKTSTNEDIITLLQSCGQELRQTRVKKYQSTETKMNVWYK